MENEVRYALEYLNDQEPRQWVRSVSPGTIIHSYTTMNELIHALGERTHKILDGVDRYPYRIIKIELVCEHVITEIK